MLLNQIKLKINNINKFKNNKLIVLYKSIIKVKLIKQCKIRQINKLFKLNKTNKILIIK